MGGDGARQAVKIIAALEQDTTRPLQLFSAIAIRRRVAQA